MIEILESAKGEKVIRYQGRLLASRFNPKAEAMEWIDSRLEFVSSVQTVIVLGLGSGYHVQALLEKTSARILILEANDEILKATLSFMKFDSSRVTVERISNARALRGSDAVKAAVKGSFIVLQHPASINLSAELYESCRTQLIGRDWGALNWQWNLRGGPNFDANARIDGGSDNALTIYDLEQTELVQNSEERERLFFKALRELVK